MVFVCYSALHVCAGVKGIWLIDEQGGSQVFQHGFEKAGYETNYHSYTLERHTVGSLTL